MHKWTVKITFAVEVKKDRRRVLEVRKNGIPRL